MTQKNSTSFVPDAASMRERFLSRLFPDRQYRQRYADFLIYQHRSFDVKGLTTQGIYTLELAQVFVDLILAPQTAEMASAAPIRPMPADLQEGRHDVWAYLQAGRQRNHPLVILGAPGSGKTTLLKHMAVSLAPLTPDESVTFGYRQLPILLVLRDHAAAIRQNPDFSIETAVRQATQKWQVDLPPDWFQKQLARGECLVMLDGLDEVADSDTRQAVVTWVERKIAEYGQNQFVITSRPYGYRSNPLRQAVVLEVQPFVMAQVERFVHNWYLANEIMSSQRDDPGVRMEAQQGAEDLLSRLRRAHVLLDMSVNPLLLTMIATVHRYRSSLPGRRVELYAEICEVFLGKRQQARGILFDLTPAQKQRVLQPLAYHMMHGQMREIALEQAMDVIRGPLRRVSPQTAVDQFLQSIVDGSGLLVEREAGVYSFAHLTFQEYLAAVHVQDQHLENEMLACVDDTWWHEVIRLYAAQVDASNIIRACLSSRAPSVQALTLAMECLEEAREVHAELRNIFEQLARSVDHRNPEIRRISSEVRLSLRTRRMLRADEDRYIDNTFVTHAEFQLFLDSERAQDRYHQPDHWQEFEFAAEQGQQPVAGIRPLDAVAFCEWLTQRDQGAWQYRLPRSNEIAFIDAHTQEEELPQPFGYWFVSAQGMQTAAIDLNRFAGLKESIRQVEAQLHQDRREHARLQHLDRTRDIVLRRARQRALMLLDLDRNLNISRLQSPDIVRDFSMALDRSTWTWAQTVAQTLDFAVATVQNLNLEQARTLDLQGVGQLGQRLAHELAHAQQYGAAPQLARALHRSLDAALAHAQNQEVVLHKELLRALLTARQQTGELLTALSAAYRQARQRVRSAALWQIDHLVGQLYTPGGVRGGQARQQVQQLLAAYIDLYLDFVILEGRINGRMPAFEGVRVVKERKPPVSAIEHPPKGR